MKGHKGQFYQCSVHKLRHANFGATTLCSFTRYCLYCLEIYTMLAIITIITLAVLSTTYSELVKQGAFVWFSDFHLDLYYGGDNAYNAIECSVDNGRHFQYGCDAPINLVKGAIAASKKVSPNPKFILVTGDLSRHGISTGEFNDPEKEVESSLSTVAKILLDTFPNSSIIPSLGNNDITPDYYLDAEHPNNDLLNSAADVFSGLLSNEELTTFRYGGYFARSLSNLRVLSINTLVYSTRHEPDQTNVIDPYEQFLWMEGQLDDARKHNHFVYIVGHIPPTIGSYR